MKTTLKLRNIMVNRISILQRCLCPIPEAYESIILHGKRDFADMSMLRVLRWRDYPGLSRQAQRSGLL